MTVGPLLKIRNSTSSVSPDRIRKLHDHVCGAPSPASERLNGVVSMYERPLGSVKGLFGKLAVSGPGKLMSDGGTVRCEGPGIIRWINR